MDGRKTRCVIEEQSVLAKLEMIAKTMEVHKGGRCKYDYARKVLLLTDRISEAVIRNLAEYNLATEQ